MYSGVALTTSPCGPGAVVYVSIGGASAGRSVTASRARRSKRSSVTPEREQAAPPALPFPLELGVGVEDLIVVIDTPALWAAAKNRSATDPMLGRMDWEEVNQHVLPKRLR